MSKKTITVSYPVIANMGDLLNENIIEEMFGYKVKKASDLVANVSGIGSGLGAFMYSDSLRRRVIEFFFGLINPKIYVWGTGFISYNLPDRSFFRRNIKFCAVRGSLSKQKVERIIGHKLNIPMGDAGILSSYLLNEPVEKKYDVGIIAHFKEQDEPVFNELVNYYNNSTFIDVKRDPVTVIKHIAQCRHIISSSLHGLIIADSLRVPNIHIKVSEKLAGDGFKFDDYYSAYGIKHPYVTSADNSFPSLQWVAENYSITDEMVKTVKESLIRVFPYKKIKQ